MPDGENGNQDKSKSLLEQIKKWRADADAGREPELLSARLGTRHYSQAALIEKITDAFLSEHGSDSDALSEADTETKRLKLILGTVDYVLGVESVQVMQTDKANIIRRAYNELFTYGPLDNLLADETITTIMLEGANKVAVRRGHGELESLEPIFENESHLKKILGRLLADAGADLTPEEPIIETGLTVNERPISLNVAAPPVTIQTNIDIRVHPKVIPTMDDIANAYGLNDVAHRLLQALVESEYGLAIIGEPESGKTTLLTAIIELLPEQQKAGLVAIQRAGEIRLPDGATNLTVRWRKQDQEPRPFGACIHEAVHLDQITCLVIDEVRADEAIAIEPLLANENTPRQIWAVRGPASSKRLISALGMLARRSSSDPTQTENRVQALYHCLPFVITLRRHKNQLWLHSVSEWQFKPDSEYPDFVELLAMDWEGPQLTGKQSSRRLRLPPEFWQGNNA